MSDENGGDRIDPATGEVVSETHSGDTEGQFRISAKKFKREYLEVPKEFLEIAGSSQEKEPLFFKDSGGNKLLLDLWPRRGLLAGLAEWYRANDVSPEDTVLIECWNREEKLFGISLEKARPESKREGLYLGKQYYMLGTSKKENTKKYLLPEADLLTHLFICGVTGSGKTVLGKALVEEAALRSIPSIVIDLKGDLSSMAIKFDSLDADEFAPWVDAKNENERKVTAEKEARRHREKLGEFGIDSKRIKDFAKNVEIRIFTPRSSKGIPIAFSSPLAAPPDALELYNTDREEFDSLVASLTTAFIDRLYPNVRRAKIENERNYLYEIVHQCWRFDIDLSGKDGLFELLRLCEDPPFAEIGGLPVGQYIDAEDRRGRLLRKINTILSGPEVLWFQGDPLNVKEQFLNAEVGKTPINIINLADLDSFEDKSFVVAQIAYDIYKWMRKQPGTTRPRLLFFIDEIGGGGGKQAFFPSYPYESAAKWGLNYLLRQGRAYGVCCVFATQNPGDIDYRALSNCNTWISGKLATKRDREKVLEGMAIWSSELERAKHNLANAETGDFVIKDARGEVHYVKERWLLTYHRVLTMHEVSRLTKGEEKEAQPPASEFMPVDELIQLGESDVREFKTTLQWDMEENRQNTKLRKSVLKTIAAFLNSKGGTLIIGVADDGTICGLDKDFKLTKSSQDKFEQLLVSLIVGHLGPAYSPCYKIRFGEVGGKVVCVIDVERSPGPVYMKFGKGKEFFVRIGNTSRSLDTEDAHRYIGVNWV